MSDAPLTIESFQPHIGTAFTVHTDQHEEVLTLKQVDAGKPSYPGGRDPFALVFDGSSNDLMFHSQTVVFHHPEMGELAFLISPFGRNDDGTFRYEAVFN